MAMIVWSRRTFGRFFAAAGLAQIGWDEVDARKRKKKRRRRKKRRAVGDNGGGGCSQSICDGQCTDLNTDVNNCGACGNACGELACCDGQCVDVTSDDTHCGQCGRVCNGERSEHCANGACRTRL